MSFQFLHITFIYLLSIIYYLRKNILKKRFQSFESFWKKYFKWKTSTRTEQHLHGAQRFRVMILKITLPSEVMFVGWNKLFHVKDISTSTATNTNEDSLVMYNFAFCTRCCYSWWNSQETTIIGQIRDLYFLLEITSKHIWGNLGEVEEVYYLKTHVFLYKPICMHICKYSNTPHLSFKQKGLKKNQWFEKIARSHRILGDSRFSINCSNHNIKNW